VTELENHTEKIAKKKEHLQTPLPNKF